MIPAQSKTRLRGANGANQRRRVSATGSGTALYSALASGPRRFYRTYSTLANMDVTRTNAGATLPASRKAGDGPPQQAVVRIASSAKARTVLDSQAERILKRRAFRLGVRALANKIALAPYVVSSRRNSAPAPARVRTIHTVAEKYGAPTKRGHSWNYKSRHMHAVGRPRGGTGRFVKRTGAMDSEVPTSKDAPSSTDVTEGSESTVAATPERRSEGATRDISL